MSLRLARLPADPAAPFPDPSLALREPDGLLAIGGDLEPARLLRAYASGIFPWYSDGQPLLWWSPDPRTVFTTNAVRMPSRFRRQLRGSGWVATADTAFDEVITACATAPRPGQEGTWITAQMHRAYRRLHALGHAHSVEVWSSTGGLVGGIYGVAVGRMFFGESMVSLASGGSRAALGALAMRLRDWNWPLIDAQLDNPHLRSLGAQSWPRARFLDAVRELTACPGAPGSWTRRFGRIEAHALAPVRG
ncbi:leucyl/phenylalanyl-tRNA--protein transferase [Lysobacter sp. GX 14042]|uniref:leucyl/phenylalanyl-tRNA--protein transferase n=1 Tax=Lysobacter sp. GX 14042 TaxID=2907155 RepID=UPI001F1A530C|nr:leucyl/phenylalanyl-tRNA--protein transferase [Lysobacter sp. GX 14042]MCE7031343.1 leucyl/phenylalanyl-tRNA--protein transferase [Lysobacter sp. GX 14042]